MRKFYEKVVNHPVIVFTLFGLALIICLCCQPFIDVNYNINDYLPENSASTIALDVMEEEYEGGIPNAEVMIEDVSIAEALEYKEKLKSVEGVSDVTWLDDSVDIEQPLESLDQDTVETYYIDETALFSITIDEEYRVSAVDEIREIIGEENYMTGSAVSTALATTSTVSEIYKIAAFAIAFCFLVLVFTTTSYAQPFIILGGLGVAVLINSGTNIIFGEISFVTNAAGSILQIAVSLDYSVFLIHRYTKMGRIYKDSKEAMIEALVSSTSSILSSGLTTLIGFLALCFMQFLIGPDLGLALAKGIAISLITVFIFMPNLILKCTPIIEKTRHKRFAPEFNGLAKAVKRFMKPLVVIFLVMVIPAYLASNSNDFYYGASHIFGSNTQYGSDTDKIEEVFGQSDTYVIMVSKNSTATEKQLSNELKDLDQVKSILSYVDTVGASIPEEYLDEGTLSQLNSEHYTRLVLTVDASYEGEDTFTLVEEIRNLCEKYYPDEWYLAGEGVSTYDLMDTITSDMIKVNGLAIGAVFIVLLLSMKSITLPIILVLSIETAIWINLSIPYFLGNHVFYIAYLIINSIQLGATVDYAILLTDTYKENRKTLLKGDAISETIKNCILSILTSSTVLMVAGFALGYISTHGLLSELGYFLCIGAICSLLIVLFVLPGLLYIFDKPIQKTTKGLSFINEKEVK